MKYRSEFICGGANTVASSACWTRFQQLSTETKEVVAYCVDNLIAVVDVSKSVVTETLRGHIKRINVLKASKNYLISASEDSTVRVWNYGQNCSWEKYAVLSGVMNSSIIALSCLDTAFGLLIAAADVSGRVAIWSKRNSDDDFIVLQVVDMPSAQMPHELHLSELPGTGPLSSTAKPPSGPDILLLIGSVDTRVHIRLASQQNILSCLNTPKNSPEISSSGIFKLVGTLPGHEEWITCLATVVSESRTLLLASGSKDAKIRIWRLSLSPQSSTGISTDLQQLDKFKELDIADEDKDEEEDALDAPEGAIEMEPDESLSEARLMFVTPSGFVCSVFLEALLVGHEDWVSSVHWMADKTESELNVSVADGNTSKAKANSTESTHRLYSTSMDRSVPTY
jgi:elongator complex protein 2